MQNIRCGNKVHNRDLAQAHYHYSVDEVRECYASPKGIASIEEDVFHHDELVAHSEWEAEMAIERHYENAGYWEARADEDHEMAMGIDPFNPLGPAFGSWPEEKELPERGETPYTRKATPGRGAEETPSQGEVLPEPAGTEYRESS